MSVRNLVASALVTMLVVACGGSSAGGTLQAIIEAEGETAGFGDFTTGRDKSFGIFVCSQDGSVEIESIEAVKTEGDVEFLGAMVYTSADRFVGAAHGYPPDGIDETEIEPVEGSVIDSDCENPGSDDRVQLLIGAERTGSGGGVVDGLLVQTSGGELEIPFTILLCGDELEYCEALIPEDDR